MRWIPLPELYESPSVTTRSIRPEPADVSGRRGKPGRYGHADEFGKAAAFLLSDAASYITGATLQVEAFTTFTDPGATAQDALGPLPVTVAGSVDVAGSGDVAGSVSLSVTLPPPALALTVPEQPAPVMAPASRLGDVRWQLFEVADNDDVATTDASLVGQGISGTVGLHTIRPLDFDERIFAVNLRGDVNELADLVMLTPDLLSKRGSRSQR